jgi:hypothetical protein
MIREKTNGGEEMIDLALQIMRGEITETRVSSKGEPFEVGPSCRERLEAVKWLTERGWGRAPEMDAEEQKPAQPTQEMTPEQLEAIAAGGEA